MARATPNRRRLPPPGYIDQADQGAAIVVIEAPAARPAAELGRARPVRADNDQQLIDLWLRGHGSNNTRAAYARDVKRLQALGVGLQALTYNDLLDFADSLAELAPRSQKRTLAAVKSLLTFGHTAGYLQYNVGAALQVPKIKNNLAERIATEAAIIHMIKLEADQRKRLMLVLLYGAGLRVSELCGLAWRDAAANRDAGQLTIMGKGDKTRVVLLKADTWAQLQAQKPKGTRPDDPIFATKTGKPLGRAWVWALVKKAAARAGLPANFSPHWCRHAHASHALDRGAPVHLVQQTLGHASLDTTTQYSHARPDDSSARYLAI